jgi:hypothetical protein
MIINLPTLLIKHQFNWGFSSNRQESQELSDTIFSTKSEKSSKLVPGYTDKYVSGLRRKKIPAVNQHRQSRILQPKKPYLQTPSINENGERCILTIVNGVTNVNPTSVTVPKNIFIKPKTV